MNAGRAKLAPPNRPAQGDCSVVPDGFAEKYKTEASSNDDPSAFDSKTELVGLMETQRAGTLAALAKLSDADLEKPAPEPLQRFGATVGAIIAGQITHWMMHAGQWVIVRRQLGKEAVF